MFGNGVAGPVLPTVTKGMTVRQLKDTVAEMMSGLSKIQLQVESVVAQVDAHDTMLQQEQEKASNAARQALIARARAIPPPRIESETDEESSSSESSSDFCMPSPNFRATATFSPTTPQRTQQPSSSVRLPVSSMYDRATRTPPITASGGARSGGSGSPGNHGAGSGSPGNNSYGGGSPGNAFASNSPSNRAGNSPPFGNVGQAAQQFAGNANPAGGSRDAGSPSVSPGISIEARRAGANGRRISSGDKATSGQSRSSSDKGPAQGITFQGSASLAVKARTLHSALKKPTLRSPHPVEMRAVSESPSALDDSADSLRSRGKSVTFSPEISTHQETLDTSASDIPECECSASEDDIQRAARAAAARHELANAARASTSASGGSPPTPTAPAARSPPQHPLTPGVVPAPASVPVPRAGPSMTSLGLAAYALMPPSRARSSTPSSVAMSDDSVSGARSFNDDMSHSDASEDHGRPAHQMTLSPSPPARGPVPSGALSCSSSSDSGADDTIVRRNRSPESSDSSLPPLERPVGGSGAPAPAIAQRPLPPAPSAAQTPAPAPLPVAAPALVVQPPSAAAPLVIDTALLEETAEAKDASHQMAESAVAAAQQDAKRRKISMDFKKTITEEWHLPEELAGLEASFQPHADHVVHSYIRRDDSEPDTPTHSKANLLFSRSNPVLPNAKKIVVENHSIKQRLLTRGAALGDGAPGKSAPDLRRTQSMHGSQIAALARSASGSPKPVAERSLTNLKAALADPAHAPHRTLSTTDIRRALQGRSMSGELDGSPPSSSPTHSKPSSPHTVPSAFPPPGSPAFAGQAKRVMSTTDIRRQLQHRDSLRDVEAGTAVPPSAAAPGAATPPAAAPAAARSIAQRRGAPKPVAPPSAEQYAAIGQASPEPPGAAVAATSRAVSVTDIRRNTQLRAALAAAAAAAEAQKDTSASGGAQDGTARKKYEISSSDDEGSQGTKEHNSFDED